MLLFLVLHENPLRRSWMSPVRAEMSHLAEHKPERNRSLPSFTSPLPLTKPAVTIEILSSNHSLHLAILFLPDFVISALLLQQFLPTTSLMGTLKVTLSTSMNFTSKLPPSFMQRSGFCTWQSANPGELKDDLRGWKPSVWVCASVSTATRRDEQTDTRHLSVVTRKSAQPQQGRSSCCSGLMLLYLLHALC